MNVTIVGATSQSVPGLFVAVAASGVLAETRFTLVARDAAKLHAVRRAIGLVHPGAMVDAEDCTDDGLRRAFANADIIILQIRYGGLAARAFDESFPLPYGICGDEGLGPGGLSAAWRTWPPLRRMLELLQQCNRGAEVYLLTSPGSLLARLVQQRFPTLAVRAFCELPWTTRRDHTPWAADAYDYLGINHLGWVYGEGAAPVPLKYWRLHHERDAVLREQRLQSEPRALALRRMSDASFDVFATGTADDVRVAASRRAAPWYTDALVPMLESRITGASATDCFFSVPNAGRYPAFTDDDVLEIPHRRQPDRTFVRRPVTAEPPPALVSALHPFVAYERLAADAVAERDRNGIETALAAHPWVIARGTAQVVRPLTEHILTQR